MLLFGPGTDHDERSVQETQREAIPTLDLGHVLSRPRCVQLRSVVRLDDVGC